MHVSDTNAEKDLNAYHRRLATVILAGVKLAGKGDTARKVYVTHPLTLSL